MCRLAKVLLLMGVLCGLCLPAQANTTAPSLAPSSPAPAIVPAAQAGNALAPEDMPAAPPGGPVLAPSGPVRIALLLPLRADALAQAADAVRAGFMAAYKRERGGIAVDVVKTDDTPDGVLAAYNDAAAKYDIVVGPLSRTGVTAVARRGAVSKPTLALNAPDTQDGSEPALPPLMLSIGLSIDEEARQVADWAGAEDGKDKAYVVFTDTPWQRRAADAFAARWRQLGLALTSVEIGVNDGYLDWRRLAQLKKQVQSGKPALLFAALDAWQAKQLREAVGGDVPLYGTSQLNPFALPDWQTAGRIAGMDGARLLDIPWQLDPAHPAVMVYPRLVVDADKKRSPDIERLYALGIDAYRVAREIAEQHTDFELDGVTGKLSVHFAPSGASFARDAEHAVYRDGMVTAAQ